MKKLLTFVFFVGILCVSNKARGGWTSIQSEMFFAGCSDECISASETVSDLVNVHSYCECFCHEILHNSKSFYQANQFVQNALDGVEKERKQFDEMMYQCFVLNQNGGLK